MINEMIYEAGGSPVCGLSLPCPQGLGTRLLFDDDIKK